MLSQFKQNFIIIKICPQFVQNYRNCQEKMILSSLPIFQTQDYCSTLFSDIFIARDIQNETQLIVKKDKSQDCRHLKNQMEILIKMQQYQGFPRVYYTQAKGNEQLKQIHMQKLGISLKSLISNSNAANIKIPIMSLVNLGFQMLDRVEKLHMNGYLHNDLKPDHFLFQTNDPSSCIFLIDFGLSAKIAENQPAQFLSSAKNMRFKGNIAYSSVNKMKCRSPSIRDDLESIVYIIGEMLEGELPWRPRHASTKDSWRSIFSSVLLRKMQKQGWKKYGQWISQTLAKVQQGEDPYRQLRKSICQLLELEF